MYEIIRHYTGRCRRVVLIPHNSIENSLQKHVKQFERDPTVKSLDTDLLSRYSCPVGGMAQTGRCRWVVLIPRNSIENSLQKHVKTFERDPTVGSLDKDLWSRYSGHVGGMAQTGRYRRVVRSSQNSRENSLRKHMKKFERNSTVRS